MLRHHSFQSGLQVSFGCMWLVSLIGFIAHQLMLFAIIPASLQLDRRVARDSVTRNSILSRPHSRSTGDDGSLVRWKQDCDQHCANLDKRSPDIKKLINANISANSTSCGEKQLISQHGIDGFGHQLLGLQSCVLLTLLQPENYIFVQKELINVQHGFGLGTYRKLIGTLQEDFPASPGRCEVVKSDHCFEQLQRICPYNGKCAMMKKVLSMYWRDKIGKIPIAKKFLLNHKQDEMVVHLRGGDRKEVLYHGWETLPSIVKELCVLTGTAKVSILFEESADEPEVSKLRKSIQHTVPSLRIRQFIGGSALQMWLRMVTAKILVLSQSSFSLSAALFRCGYTVSVDRYPLGGRYDANALPCSFNMTSTGLHEADQTIEFFWGFCHGLEPGEGCKTD
uniref:Uncharacterized protein n=1 Tax=Picocystis salinarum TaxID=88271 RepID=A0A7S3UCY0_9CHLO|mmetsp:Transcript_5231/g.32903  ORF Transcript_5231/g.32903 Transcript_5231/m.32903 type:complete len:395 (-) Transcript_5231:1637-2821(-)